VIDILASLVDKSLVVVEEKAGDGTRYRLLETIGEYARARLREAGEEAVLRRRHQDYFVQWAETLEVRAQGPENLDILARLACEHDNFRAVLTWCLKSREEGRGKREEQVRLLLPDPSSLFPSGEAGLRLVGALGYYWEAHGHFQEGRRYLQEALAQTTQLEP